MTKMDFSEELAWTAEAKIKLKNIPYFVRTQARKRIEELARENDLREVNADIVAQARAEFGQ